MGMQLERFGDACLALRFGNQKINLHVRGKEYEPKAHLPVPGALDLCFMASIQLDGIYYRSSERAGLADYRGACAANRRHAEDSIGLCS